MTNTNDVIKHPNHYVSGRKYEPKDVIRDWGLNFNLGNAVKYVARAGRKDDIIQDLRKAQEYIQFEIDAIELERETGSRCPIDAIEEHTLKVTLELPEDAIVIEVPAGTSPEDIINEVITVLYGGK